MMTDVVQNSHILHKLDKDRDRDRNRTVSFNKDVHVKRIVPVKHKSRSTAAADYATLPVKHNKNYKVSKEIVENKLSSSKGRKYNTLPPRFKKRSKSTDLAIAKQQSQQLPSTAILSNLHRSKSDATSSSNDFNNNSVKWTVLNDDQKPLTPIEEEHYNKNKQPSQLNSSATDYLREYINEIDNESHNYNDPKNLKIDPEEMLKSDPPNQIIYAQVICNKNKPFTKKETTHTIIKKNVNSSDSDEGLGGCKNSKTTNAPTPTNNSNNIKKSYIRFGDEIDSNSAATAVATSHKEELIEPKVRHYETRRFFDMDNEEFDRGQADGMDSKWDHQFIERDGNELLTVQNLRKRNELSERRNLLEDRINLRWNQRYGPKEDNAYVEKYVQDMKLEKIDTDRIHKTYSKHLNTLEEVTEPRLVRYKSNPELISKNIPRTHHYKNIYKNYEFDEDYDYGYNNQELQETVYKKNLDNSYKRNRTREGIRIVQTKSLQNLTRKKISDESEDEGFASSILIPSENQKVKKTGFQRVKQLFSRDSKKKKCQQENGKFVQYRRPDSETDSMSHNYRNKNSEHSSSNHGHSRGWFKSLDRLTMRRDKEEKENISAQEKQATMPKKNLRFFGDTNTDSVHNQKTKTGRYRSNTNSTSSSSSTNHRFQTHDRYKSHSFTDLKDSDDERMRMYHQSRNTTSRNPKNRSMQHLDQIKSNHRNNSGENVIYLHAATVGEIPDPNNPQRNNKHTYSQKELSPQPSTTTTTITSTQPIIFQPRIKSVSRSFSLLAPWRPKHREEVIIDYSPKSRYAKKSSKSSDSSDYNSSNGHASAQRTSTNIYKKKDRFAK